MAGAGGPRLAGVARVVGVSPNPALDRVVIAAGAARGGTVRAASYREAAGGKAINAALVASALGASVLVVAPLGGGRGDRVAAAAAAAGIRLCRVPIRAETRGTYVVCDPAVGDVIEVLEPPPVLVDDEPDAFAAAVREHCHAARVVMSCGSTPGGIDDAVHARSVAAGRAAGAFTIVDAAADPLRAALTAQPDLVKPNLAEACDLVGVAVSAEDDAGLRRLADALHERGAVHVWISLGRHGSMLSGPGRDAVRLAPAQPVVGANAVCCGDAMVGGFAAGHAAGLDLLAAARLGAAAAAAKLAVHHTSDVTADAVRAIEPLIRVTPLTSRLG
jgi:1-phosphofructokinase family hexose kinase